MTLKFGTSEQKSQMITDFQKGIKNIITECQQIAWYSRGSIQYADAFELTPFERQNFMDMVKDQVSSQCKGEGLMRTLIF